MEETGFRVIRKARKRTRSESSDVDEIVSNDSDSSSSSKSPSSPERPCCPEGDYHCRTIPVYRERSINEILKVVSLQSFSHARLGVVSPTEDGYGQGHETNSQHGDEPQTEDSRSNNKSNSCTNGSSSVHLDNHILQAVVSSKGKRNIDKDKVVKDNRYWEKRQRNNASAKRSRDARRVRELETQIRAEYLIDENQKLKHENELLREENHRLQRTIEDLELQLKNAHD